MRYGEGYKNKNPYSVDYVERIKEAKDDFELSMIIDRIYEDGFEDGNSEGFEVGIAEKGD
uniref:Uncharacterized protein n=1 Tax=viral metagenome TaxID=1070528 RepID=A0A6H1ZD57_9ZZZZ